MIEIENRQNISNSHINYVKIKKNIIVRSILYWIALYLGEDKLLFFVGYEKRNFIK